jgi:hypothetical protein
MDKRSLKVSDNLHPCLVASCSASATRWAEANPRRMTSLPKGLRGVTKGALIAVLNLRVCCKKKTPDFSDGSSLYFGLKRR